MSASQFEVKSTEEKHRGCFAVRDIDEQALLVEEEPAVVLPDLHTQEVCLECYRKVNRQYLCKGCGLPMCSKHYRTSSFHLEECKIIRKAGFMRVATDIWIYEVVSTLRVLLHLKRNASLDNLMDHVEEMKLNHNQWKEYEENVVAVIYNMDLEGVSERDIERSIGLTRTNAYSVEIGDDKRFGTVRLLLPRLSMFNHSCAPNLYCVLKPGPRIQVYSQAPIKKGSELCITYLPSVFLTLPERQAKLQTTWFFTCKCKRCNDPSEFGTNFSSILCPGCKNMVAPSLNNSTFCFRCDCGSTVQAKAVEGMMAKLEKDIEQCEDNDDLKDVIEKFSKVFHPNHAVIVKLLSRMASTSGSFTNKPSLQDIQENLLICKTVMDTLGLLDPGFPSWRGVILYQDYLNRARRITMLKNKDEIKEERSTLVENLQEISKCLCREPDRSIENKIFKMAKAQLTEIQKMSK